MAESVPLVAFQESLQHYIEEAKPDPLELKQISSWKLSWKQEKTTANQAHSSQSLNGTLEIQGEFMTVIINSNCKSTVTESSNIGTLDFELSARAEFVTSQDHAVDDDNVNRKIRTEMTRRLRNDDYIKPLLSIKEGILLCEAHIQLDNDTNKLEERVFMDETVLHGVLRCIYSRASSTLSMLELLLSFPYLPNALGKRAKLRLLEDAMAEACQQQDEDEMLQDLSIQEHESKKAKTTDTT